MSATRLKSGFARAGSRTTSLIREDHNELPRRDRTRFEDDIESYFIPTWLFKDLKDVWVLVGSSYINVLLVFVPFGVLSNLLEWHPIARFTLNFLAILPLQGLISFATEEVAILLGQTTGGLLNSILGNSTELIVGIIALSHNEVQVVQASIMGSIFSNMLLIPGTCFFASGISFREQWFAGSIVSTMLFPTLASIMSLLAPAALYSVTEFQPFEQDNLARSLSVGSTVVLLLLHGANLLFQLKTHVSSFEDVNAEEEDGEPMEPNVNVWTAAICLPLTLFLIVVCANGLMSTLSAIISQSGLTRTFIGFVLLPFLANAAEQITAVIVACKNKPELSLAVSNGGVMQTILFVTPVLVISAAFMDRPLTLFFGRFEIVAVLFASVLLAALLQKGTANYFDGLLCLGLYSIVVVASCVLPE